MFTVDYFSEHIPVWLQMLERFREGERYALEIGSLEGRSASWLLETFPNFYIDCVDAWADTEQLGGAEHERRFDENMAKFDDRVGKAKGRSVEVLSSFLSDHMFYSFIYIDGSHEARDVIADAALCWEMLAPGGLMCFDDYKRRARHAKHQACEAIDAFIRWWPAVVVHRDQQVWVEKPDVC